MAPGRPVELPKVSVCIPTYNYGRYLSEAIRSILDQSFADFELIIRDDCSQDHTSNVVQEFASADPRIRFSANNRNLGMVRNWNRCLAEARGEYVKFVFGDDFLASNKALERMVAALDQHPEVSLVASARRVTDQSSRRVDVWSEFVGTQTLKGPEAIRSCLCRQGNLIGEPSAVLFRRKDSARGFDENYRQLVDLEMWLHLLGRGDLFYIEEPLCGFRVHPEQQTAKNKLDWLHYKEMTSILQTYMDKADIGSRLGIFYIRMDHAYRIWKLYRREKPRRDMAREILRQQTPVTKFLIALPLYKAVKPLLKLSRMAGRESLIGIPCACVSKSPYAVAGSSSKLFSPPVENRERRRS